MSGPTSDLHAEIRDWMYAEAELLDDGFERKWLETMVSKDIVYQVPLRQTVERARGAGWVDGTYHLDERYGSLETRVARNETQYAWAEDPPSRIRHFVTNLRVREDADGLVRARTNLLVYRTRQDGVVPQMLSGERWDVLRREDGVLRLLERRMLLDLTAIGTHNLSIFF
ncbi:aromatic-ring-hydroxylating dioxygenase subunit beta [Amycolatopsis orientalis]|uniref:aromatic-ring-hydroxylating dioxygenase subunit beta n=1 Tax=Amycolatopsis orientalis TaxID=31958 RepID=UPI0005683B42|nr:aromatic-ring-hydroxylating dioxygenase subunit beta [Amycolatopsis orientalis]